MALVSTVPEKREIPGEAGEWVEFRRLPWKKLRDARKTAQAEQREDMKALGGEFLRIILESQQGRDDERAKRLQAEIRTRDWDVENFDRDTLLRKGIAAWSYAADVAEGIDQLDEQTADWMAREILALSRPPTEAEQKNVSGSSIAS